MKNLKVILFLAILVAIVGVTQQVKADTVKTKEMYILGDTTVFDKAGLSKGIHHDKQNLGIILPANIKLEIRQINPNYKGSLTMELLNDDSQKEKAVTITSDWQTVANPYTSVPFIQTTFGGASPILEYKVTDTMKTLPVYQKGDNEAAFFKQWDDSDAEFALIYTKYFQTFAPKKDKAFMKNMKDFASIDSLINYYTEVFETYNELAGLSFTTDVLTDKNISNRYFMKANAHGAGSAYYGGNHTAQNDTSLAAFYLSKGWGGLHEIAHGYQGSFMDDQSLNVGEVWNNLYAATFEKLYYGEDLPNKGMLYADGSKEWREVALNKAWQIEHKPMNSWELNSKERILLSFQAKAGDKALTVFNQEFRKMANKDGFVSKDHYLLDLVSKYYGQVSGYDFTPTILSAGGVMSRAQHAENLSKNYKPVAPLVELVPSASVASIQSKLGLESYLSLVDTDQITSVSTLAGKSTIHLKIDDLNQIKNHYLIIKNGKKEVKRIEITSKDVEVGTLPNGIYTIYAPTGETTKYALDEHYLRVKEATNELTINYSPKKASAIASQVIHFRGLGDWEFASAVVDLNKEQLVVNVLEEAHWYFDSNIYTQLDVIDTTGAITYTKVVKGLGKYLESATPTIKEGYKIRIYHAEPGRLQVDKLNIVDTTQKTNTFTVTKTGLVNDKLKNNSEQSFMDKIAEKAAMIANNQDMLNNKYSEEKDDLWLAINTLTEPNKTILMDKYSDLLPEEQPKVMTLNETTISSQKGEEGQVKATLAPAKSNQKVTYVSGDSSVITIDKDGHWTARGAGETTINVISEVNPSLTKTISVKVTFSGNLTANAFKINDGALTGTYGSAIAKVRLWINGKVVAQATTKADGTFVLATAAQFILNTTDKVEIVGVDDKYVEKNRIIVTVTGTSVVGDKLTVESYKLGSSTIHGTFGKSISKVRLWVNGKVVLQATTSSDGNYEFMNISNYIQLPSDKVEIVGVDAQYNELNRILVPITGTPTIDNKLAVSTTYRVGEANLSGSYGNDVFKVRLWVNGKVVTQATSASGIYTFTNISSYITSPMDVVQVVAVDSQYKEINRMDVDITGLATYNYLLSSDTFTTDMTKLTGSYGKDVSEIKLSVGGVIVKEAMLDKVTRSYAFNDVSSYIKNTTDTIRVIAYNAQHQEVNRIAISIQ